jgi:hypothetical protein
MTVVSFASKGREEYRGAQLRMIESCMNAGFNGPYYLMAADGYCKEFRGVEIITGRWPKDCDVHSQKPYQFKPMLIREAVEAGHKKILWMDSTCRMLKVPKLEGPITAWNNEGHPLDRWINFRAVTNCGVESIRDIEGVRQIMACCVYFDFDHTITVEVFNEWVRQGQIGSFNDDGLKSPHRHDQAVLSLLLWKAGIELKEYGDGFCYGDRLKDFPDCSIINKGV